MLPPERLDRIHVAFDDHRLVANAGLLLPVTLAHHLGLGELVDRHVDLGRVPGRANAGDKMLTPPAGPSGVSQVRPMMEEASLTVRRQPDLPIYGPCAKYSWCPRLFL